MAIPAERRDLANIKNLQSNVPSNPGIGNQGVIGHSSNLFPPIKTKETAASTGMDHGANSIEKGSHLSRNSTAKRHGSASNMLHHALTLDTSDCWWGLKTVFKARLTVNERASIALMVLRSLDPGDVEKVVYAALTGTTAGQPIPPLMSAKQEANDWAAFATQLELKIYALACFEHLSEQNRVAFLSYVSGRAAS
ncbi:MAG: hypothetical protein GY924_19580 [Planctomycetaceae bacterium]|nr:hypothetical protein [Planctomycetaceae bacterium]